MDTYQIDVTITLRKIEADGVPALEWPSRYLTISGNLAALELIVTSRGWKRAAAETAFGLLATKRKANED